MEDETARSECEETRVAIGRVARSIAEAAHAAAEKYEFEPDEWIARIIGASAEAAAIGVGVVIADWCVSQLDA